MIILISKKCKYNHLFNYQPNVKNPSKPGKHYSIIYLLHLFVKVSWHTLTYSHQLLIWNPNSVRLLSAISLSITKYLSKTSPKSSILLLVWFKRLNECLQSWIVVLLGTSFQTEHYPMESCLSEPYWQRTF